MKLINLFFLGLLIFCASCKKNAESNSDMTSSTVAETATSPNDFDNESVKRNGGVLYIYEPNFNFGTVKEGAKVVKEFKVRNDGTDPIIVASVSASCGCTVPEKPEGPILPGEESAIKVSFDSNHRVGENHKTVTIISDAENSPSKINFTINVEQK